MPSFEGQVSELELLDLITFIKGLDVGQTPARNEATPPPASGSSAGSAPIPAPTPQAVPVTYLNVAFGVRSWLLTADHKRIAILYLVSITLMFILGGIAATLIRVELLTPAGDLMGRDTYNKTFTMHGI